jgi:hypothetical protein
MIEIIRQIKYDDINRDSMINLMLSWHQLAFYLFSNFLFLFIYSTRAGSPQQHMPITVGRVPNGILLVPGVQY